MVGYKYKAKLTNEFDFLKSMLEKKNNASLESIRAHEIKCTNEAQKAI